MQVFTFVLKGGWCRRDYEASRRK